MIAGALMAKNKININKIDPNVVKTEISILRKIGIQITKKKNLITIRRNKKLKNINIATSPYPGFPTDLQAQLMVLLTQVNGVSKIKEDIFENRFLHVLELQRMGANIQINNNVVKITGIFRLYGAVVMATDLRASVCLVLAGLIARGKTVINRVYHLERGYEDLVKKLKKCGAKIKFINA